MENQVEKIIGVLYTTLRSNGAKTSPKPLGIRSYALQHFGGGKMLNYLNEIDQAIDGGVLLDIDKIDQIAKRHFPETQQAHPEAQPQKETQAGGGVVYVPFSHPMEGGNYQPIANPSPEMLAETKPSNIPTNEELGITPNKEVQPIISQIPVVDVVDNNVGKTQLPEPQKPLQPLAEIDPAKVVGLSVSALSKKYSKEQFLAFLQKVGKLSDKDKHKSLRQLAAIVSKVVEQGIKTKN